MSSELLTDQVEGRDVPGGIRLMSSVSIRSISVRAREGVPKSERVADRLPAHLLFSGVLAPLFSSFSSSSSLAVVVGHTRDGNLLPTPAAPPGHLI
jgi:hypothetical protein